MKKITIWLSLSFLLAFCQTSIAQFSCDSPIMITDGYTADGITTPGTAGIEDWNDPNPDSCTSNAFYWDDDVYLFGYTAGANDEEISMTIFTRNGWNGIGIFSDCNGTALEGCLASASSTTGNVSQTVLANVGAGETVYIAIGQWGSPNDLDFDVTAFNAVELVDPPSCSTFTTPVDDSIDVLEDTAINWTQATGGATGYRISIGTSTGGVDIVNDLDLGNVLTYTPSTPLAYSTEYFVNVTPYNSNGDAQGCAELSFTTREEPPAGSICSNPIMVTTPLPYVTTDDTSNYGDDYTGGPGANCGSTSGYLGGDDVVYSYTSAVDTSIDIALSGVGTYTGIFVYTDCANIGSQCETGAVNGFAGGDMLIDNYTVTSGTTYYIVISTWPSPQSTPYTLTITENTCVDAEAIFSTVSDCANGDQFLVEVDLTSLGSAGTITISDDQGSTPQTVDAVGVYTFGPYAHGTPVIMTAANDDDSNCTLVSTSLTENYCLDNIVDCAVGPVNTTFCYFNNIDDDPSVATFSYTSTDGSQLNLTINAGQMESCCDELVVIDSDGTILYNQNTPNPAGLTFQSSGDTISWYVNSDVSVSCESNGYTPFDVTVACATCENPEATFSTVSDCTNGNQFLVEVDLTSLGSAGTITISDDQGSTPQTVDAVGVYTFGPYAHGTPVIMTAANDDDSNCTLVSASLTENYCLDNIVDCAVGPVNTTFCYFNNIDDDPSVATFSYTSTDGSQLNLTINAGQMEGCCDELVVIDSDGTILYNQNTPNPAGLTFQSSGDTISWYINSDGSVSCESNGYTPFDVTVACATCENAEATFSTVSDCTNGNQFLVEVDLTSLGSAGTITISDDQGSTPQTVDAVGVYTFGPYAHGTPVIMTAANDDDANCTLVSASLTEEYCLDNIVDCDLGPVNTTFCYFNNIDDDPSVATFTYTSSNGLPLNLTINDGQMEGCCDELVVIDSDGTILYNQNTPNPAGLTFQSSGDTISWYINSDGSVSCENNGYTPFDVTVACATCINPQATYQVVDDCDNGDQFLIDVNVTSLGDANSLTISNNIDATTVSVPSEGVYQIGPFPFLVDVVVTVSSDDDVNCVINSSPIQLLACPPENDNPCNAIVANVNEDNSCDLVTAGTIIEATPSGVPDGECGGDPDDDVWFQFTALNEVQLISITNITGGTTNLDHGLYEGTCDGLTELYCSADTASVTPELVVGNTYYIRVFSGGSVGETSTFDLCIKDAPTNIICENAENFCQEGGALVTSNIIGIPDPNDIACLGSAPNPTWNIIQIGDPGLIEIEISQVDDNGNGIDVDFVLWGPFESVADSCTEIAFEDCPSCPNNTSNPDFYPFGNIVDCSYSFVSVENLTIDNAQTGEIYILLVTNFSDDPGTISISQTNGGDDGDGNVTAEIEVDLGPDQSFCGFPSYDLVADSPFADRYEWYCDGFIIEGEESSVLTVTESCTYTVIAYDDQCDAQAQDQVTVIFGLEPVANPVDDIVTCDDASGDEIEDFDLEMQTAGILGAQDPSLFNVTYHLTLTDAQTDTGALTSPYTNISNPQTIYVRVEDANPDASFCFATTSFDLIISGPTPTATSIDIEACDDNSGDGIEDFDLAAYDADILNGQDPTEFTVTYHETEADAEAGQNAIDTSSLYTSDSQTIYVRVESNSAFDCYSTTSVNLIVLPIPVATFNTADVDYEVCPNATVPIEIALIPQGYSESDVTVEWYQDGGLISGETGLTLPVLTQGLYTAIITYNDSTCTYEVSETVIELESCVIPEGISPGVSPGQNDTFDLSSYGVTRLEIFNRNGVLVYSKDNYTNEWYGQSNSGDELPVGTYFYTMIYENGAKKRSAWVYINK
ncbi:gliding motility-associated C-terminal domain-containing protein [Gaetbulibacter sp. PBL-D1]